MAVDSEAASLCGQNVGRENLLHIHRRGRHYGFTASNEMLFTPNFLLAPRALSEMNW